MSLDAPERSQDVIFYGANSQVYPPEILKNMLRVKNSKSFKLFSEHFLTLYEKKEVEKS
jgi:hypothetical protein